MPENNPNLKPGSEYARRFAQAGGAKTALNNEAKRIEAEKRKAK